MGMPTSLRRFKMSSLTKTIITTIFLLGASNGEAFTGTEMATLVVAANVGTTITATYAMRASDLHIVNINPVHSIAASGIDTNSITSTNIEQTLIPKVNIVK
jgi:hypothetical protein